MMSDLGLWWQHPADIGREGIDMSNQYANGVPISLNYALYLNKSQVIETITLPKRQFFGLSHKFIIAAWMRASQFLDLNTVECSTGSPGKVPGDEIFVSHTRHCPFADCSVVIANKKDTPETLRLAQAGREYQVVSINEVRMRLHSHTHAPTTASLMTRWLTSARRSPIYRHGPQSHAFAFVMPQFNGDFNGDERLRADPIRKTVGRQPSAVCRQQCVVVSDQALR
jgi:hypothetical protein